MWMIVAVVASSSGAPDASSAASPSPDGVSFFENKIRPLLSEHCYQCHSQQSENLKGSLRLDSQEGWSKGGDSGPAIIPGNPDGSLLIKAVRYTDPKLQMPPKDRKLSDAQIADLEAWVRMGAPDPRTGAQPLIGFEKIMVEGRNHWAFQPVRVAPEPKVKDRRSVQSPIDSFVLAKLEAADMKPAPEADPRTLLRRASLDLTGLPPTQEEVAAFLEDKSKDAWANQIDRLLASPRYGERWARHWLDVARYADSRGYAGVGVERRFPYSYTYRDYVIRAFNEDLPYDRFIQEQIAADRLELGEDKRPLAALGFLTLGRHFLGNIHDKIDDRIDVVTRGFMGITVQCARCHDHKYDPISTKDYYGLYGIFGSSNEPEEKPLLGIAPDPVQHEEYLKERAKREQERDDYRTKALLKAMAEVRARTGDYLLAVHDTKSIKDVRQAIKLVQSRKLEETVAARWKTHLDGLAGKHDPVFTPWLAFSDLEAKDFSGKAGELAAGFAASADPDKPIHPAVSKLFAGDPPGAIKDVADRYGKLFAEIDKQWAGLVEQAGKENRPAPEKLPDADAETLRQVLYAEKAPANVPSDLHEQLLEGAKPRLRELQAKVSDVDATHPGAPARAMAMVDGKAQNARVFIRGQAGNFGVEAPRQFPEVLQRPDSRPYSNGSGRLELAQEIASRDNPLTARVLVNRVWMHHFGEGLVRTPSDLGTRSDPPTHSDLLDWLAHQFMEQGWSLKKLHKLIMTSATYRISSDADPKRAAEYVRKDANNTLLWRQNRQRLDFESMRDSLLFVAGRLDLQPASQPVDLWKEPFTTKRSIYGYIDRQNLPGVFRSFDFANPDTSASRRFTTTVPQQALFLMNSPFVIEQARQLVQRKEIAGAGTDEARVQSIYRTVLQREPSREELKLGVAFIRAEPMAAEKMAVPIWSYGSGSVDEANGRVIQFAVLPHWSGQAWQGGPKLPDPKRGWASLHSRGGHPGDNPAQMVIRRWTAPRDGVIAVEGLLHHGQAPGNGIRGRVISSRYGVLADATAHNGEASLKVDRVGVLKGDTVDFVTDSRDDTNSDSFTWVPILRYLDAFATNSGEIAAWDAGKDFSGPPAQKPEPLDGWQKFAQVLLLSNEFMFAD